MKPKPTRVTVRNSKNPGYFAVNNDALFGEDSPIARNFGITRPAVYEIREVGSLPKPLP